MNDFLYVGYICYNIPDLQQPDGILRVMYGSNFLEPGIFQLNQIQHGLIS